MFFTWQKVLEGFEAGRKILERQEQQNQQEKQEEDKGD